VQDVIEHVLFRVAHERAAPTEQLVQHDAEAINVSAAVDAMPFTAHLFGRHVRVRAGAAAALLRQVVLRYGQAEVGQVRPAAFVEQDVRRLHVAMIHLGSIFIVSAVRIVQRVGDLCDEQRGLFMRQRWFTLKAIGEGHAVDKLTDEIAMTVRVAEVIERDDRRVLQSRDVPRLGEKSGHCLIRLQAVGARHLDSDRPVDFVVVRELDDTEPAASEPAAHAIAAEVSRWLSGSLRDRPRRFDAFGDGVVLKRATRLPAISLRRGIRRLSRLRFRQITHRAVPLTQFRAPELLIESWFLSKLRRDSTCVRAASQAGESAVCWEPARDFRDRQRPAWVATDLLVRLTGRRGPCGAGVGVGKSARALR
jgi:hypothetical protein